MYLLGFSVFKEKILSGEKRQTIRILGKRRPPRVGETLRLYWHLKKRDCELLREAKCVYSEIWKWRDLKDNEEMARLDGFNNIQEFRAFFQRYKPIDDTEFIVIRWE
jgi:hypothetical protein